MSFRHSETCRTLREQGVSSSNIAFKHSTRASNAPPAIAQRNRVKNICLTCILPRCCYRSMEEIRP